MAISIRQTIHNRLISNNQLDWNSFDSEDRIQDIFIQSCSKSLWNNCITGWLYKIVKFREIKILIAQGAADNQKRILLPQLVAAIQQGASTSQLRQKEEFEIFRTDELELLVQSHSYLPLGYDLNPWKQTKHLLRKILLVKKGAHFVNLFALTPKELNSPSFFQNSPYLELVGKGAIALNFHPELRSILPPRLQTLFNRTKEIEAYFIREKKKALPALWKKIEELRSQKMPLAQQLQAIQEDPRFSVFTLYEMRLFLLGSPIAVGTRSWLQYRQDLRLAILRENGMNSFFLPLFAQTEKSLQKISEDFQSDSPFPFTPLHRCAVNAAIAIILYPEIFQILPPKIQKLLREIQNLPKIKALFFEKIQKNFEKYIPDFQNDRIGIQREAEKSAKANPTELNRHFDLDRKRSKDKTLKIVQKGTQVPFVEQERILAELQELYQRHKMNPVEKQMVQLLLSHLGYGPALAFLKIAVNQLSNDDPYYFFSLTRADFIPMTISILEKENGHLEFCYSFHQPITDLHISYADQYDPNRSFGDVSFQMTFSMERDPSTGRSSSLKGPFLKFSFSDQIAPQ